MPDRHRRAALSVFLAALLFSTGGAAIKWAHFTGWQIASFRAGIAALTLVLAIPAARRGWGWRAGLVGTAYAITCICFVQATRLTTSANAIFIQSASPFFVLVLGPLILKEPVARRDVVVMLPIALGLALVFLSDAPASATAPDPLRGNLIAALSAVTFAFAMIGFRWLGKHEGPGGATTITAAAIGNLIAFLAVLPMALPVAAHAPGDWAVLIYLGVFQIGLAYVFLARALTRVTALEASLLLLVEPALNPLWSWLVHGEIPAPLALTGATLILGATLVRAWRSEEASSLTGGVSEH